MAAPDQETRRKLLDAATWLFAAKGFRRVTVRAICQKAGANIAAVNYHFGGKMGLYRQVILSAIEVMTATTDAARKAGDGRPPEEKLRRFVRVFLERVVARSSGSWIHQLMIHEMADPTPVLDLVVDQVVLPRMKYLSGVVAAILDAPADDIRVMQAVMSVQAQCHTLIQNPASRRLLGGFHEDPAAIEAMATHIAEFSLGGLKALKS
jgi:AcrR family transcriptional regulator